MRNYNLYLQDIQAAIASIDIFVQGMDSTSFRLDDKTVSAVIRKLEVIGEAAKMVPGEVRTAHPDVPWREMAGMRDKLIHFYFGVDHELVWRTVKERLPDLQGQIEKILAEDQAP